MTFKIVCVGRIKETYYTDMIDAYKRQIGRKHELVIIQHEDEKIPQNASDTIKKKIVDTESHKCMESIGKSEYVSGQYGFRRSRSIRDDTEGYAEHHFK